MIDTIEGCVQGYWNGNIVGWAWNPRQPGMSLVLEVVVDDTVRALGIANRTQDASATSGRGDGSYGFSIPLPLDEGDLARVRVANSHFMLPGEALGPARATAPTVEGYVEHSRGLVVEGWCWDQAAPDRPLRVKAIVDGVAVAWATADEFRGDLLDAGFGNGRHVFRIHLPPELADGRERPVTIEAEDGVALKGGPVRVLALPHGPRSVLHSLMRALPLESSQRIMAQVSVIDRYIQQVEARHPCSIPWHDYEFWRMCFGGFARGDDLPPTALPAHRIIGGTSSISMLPGLADQPEILVFVDSFAQLLPGALHRALRLFTETGADILYADAEVETPDGIRPWFRPDWNYDLFLSQDYTCGIFLVRSGLLAGKPPALTIPDAKVSAIEDAKPDRIVHVPETLSRLKGADQCTDGWIPAIQNHLHRRGFPATVQAAAGNGARRRVRWPVPHSRPLVSLIVPTRDRLDLLRTCIDSIRGRTTYPNYEIIVIDNQSRDAETVAYLRRESATGSIRVVSYDSYFNFSDMNNLAAGIAKGAVLGFVNNDVELITPSWLEEVVGILSRPEVGAVGAKLLYRNEMLQHGGIVIGVDGLAENAFQHTHRNDDGYFGRTSVAGNYSAVTAACLFCRTETFHAVGGFDSANLPVAYNDVDLCLRIRESGKLIVWTPHVELYHDESVSRGRDVPPDRQARALREEMHMRARWRHAMLRDPHYSPNLNLDKRPFTGLALPPRHIWGESMLRR